MISLISSSCLADKLLVNGFRGGGGGDHIKKRSHGMVCCFNFLFLFISSSIIWTQIEIGFLHFHFIVRQMNLTGPVYWFTKNSTGFSSIVVVFVRWDQVNNDLCVGVVFTRWSSILGHNYVAFGGQASSSPSPSKQFIILHRV